MDKNKIREQLKKKFLSEESVPGIAQQKKHLKDSGKINSDGVKAIEKDVKNYDKSQKENAKKQQLPVKTNYTDDFQKTYHDEMEILNGQEMLQYDLNPSENFKERVKQGVEGSSTMGNEGGPKIGNAEQTWGASKDSFGKDLVKRIKSSTSKRSKETPTLNLRGRDIQADLEDTGHRPYAIEENHDKKDSSDKNDKKVEKPVSNHNDGEDYEKISKEVEYGLTPYDENTDNKKPQIKESMKRLKFKSPFNGLGNALRLIPENYRVDKKEFEMTDGNETYKIRWEGTLNEGKAVVLTASDKKLVNEDINRMKELFTYKSEKTLGNLRGKARLDENQVFSDMLNKTRQLIESEDMIDGDAPAPKEGEWEEVKKSQAPEAKKHVEKSMNGKANSTAKPKEGPWEEVKGGEKMIDGEAPAPKEGEWEETKVKQASEAKKHVQGSVPTDKKTEAPAPKEGPWEETKVKQASEAKKHVTLNEMIEEGPMSLEEEDEIEEPVVDAPAQNDSIDDEAGEEPADDSNWGGGEEEPEEKEPEIKDLGKTSGVEDLTAKPSLKSGAKLLQSPTTGEYWIDNKGSKFKVPDEYLYIASMSGKKGSEKAALIIQKMETEVPDVDDMTDEI